MIREMMIEWLGEQSIQPDPHDLKNWLSQNAAGFVCKEAPLGPNRLREKKGGEGGEGKGGGGGITRKSWHMPSTESAIHSLCTEHSREKTKQIREMKLY